MPNMTVTALTVSLRVNDTNYGRGSERFVSIRGEVPEGETGTPLDSYDEVLDQTLNLQLQAWEAVQGSRFVGGEVKASELQSLIESARKRTLKVKSFLRKRDIDESSDSESTES